MDFELTEDQAALLESVRAVLARTCPPSHVRSVVEGGDTPEEPWRSAVALGWTGVDAPQTIGGIEMGFASLGLVTEQLGCAVAPGPFLSTVTQFLPLLREAGDDSQQQRFAAPAIAGVLRGALAIDHRLVARHEVGTGLHARAAGDAWVLKGERRFVLGGAEAEEIAVVAAVDGGDGVGMFVVPRDAVRCEAVASLDRSRSMAHLVFDRTAVPRERVLGTPGSVAGAFHRVIEEATVAAALECVGVCQALLALTIEHAKTRRQFDQPIGAFQAVQHKCADLFVQVERARATSYFAMMAIAEDDPRRRLAASMAKAAASDCQRLVCKEGIQLHGGMGYTWESDVHLLVKRAKTLEALLGTGRDHHRAIADQVLG